ncbi:MAG: type II secretion system protein J [Elusimicrobiota bacterium]
MKNIKRHSIGYTLIEVMISVAIIGVIASTAPNLIIQLRRFFQLSNTKLEIQREARSVMNLVTRNLRQAQSSTIVIDQASAAEPYYSRISYTDVNGNYLRFYQEGRNLKLVDVSTRTIASNIRYIAFSLPRTDDMGIVSVSFTLEKGTYESKTKALHMASEKVQVMN